MELSREARIGEAVALRTKIKTDPSVRTDLLDAIDQVLRQHNIPFDDRIRTNVTIAVDDEIDGQLTAVVLPGGTNCGNAS